jgi:glycerol-3-phosphate dehydrogenase
VIQTAFVRLAAAFRTENDRVWTSTDLVGCAVCAALKSCYALGVGLGRLHEWRIG